MTSCVSCRSRVHMCFMYTYTICGMCCMCTYAICSKCCMCVLNSKYYRRRVVDKKRSQVGVVFGRTRSGCGVSVCVHTIRPPSFQLL